MFYALFDMGMAVITFIIGILFYKSNGKAAKVCLSSKKCIKGARKST